MKFNKLVSRISMIALTFFTMTSCSMIKKTDEAIRNEVLATYVGKTVTRGEVEDYFKGFDSVLVERYGEDYRNSQEYVNEQLKSFAQNYAQNSILISEVDKKGLITEEELNKKINERTSEVMHTFIDEQNGTLDDGHGHKVNEQKLNEALKQSFYVDIEDFKAKQRDIIKMDTLIESIIKDIKVSDEEVSKYYEQNKDSQFVTGPGAVMYHILVNTEEDALKVKERLNAGEKYEDLAAELNPDATSQTGGSLGFVEYESKNFDSDFLAGARNLEEGQISDPVKTQFGYHIIKVTDIKNEPVYDDFDSVKVNIENSLLTEKQQKAVLEYSENLFKEKKLKLK